MSVLPKCSECQHKLHARGLCTEIGVVCLCGTMGRPRIPFSSPHDAVDHPQHYGGDVEHEHVKCMIGSGLVWDGLLYNATKYLWRVGKKDGAPAIQDLRKAAWYLQKRIELEEHRPACSPDHCGPNGEKK